MAQKTAWTGAALTESDINTYLMHEGGAWTSFTPVISQVGTPTFTIGYSKYARSGRMITWSFQLSLTSAGTAGTQVTITVPVTATSTASLTGTGNIYDSSTTTRHHGTIQGASTTAVAFFTDTAGASANAWGSAPNLALASGDVIQGHIVYEAAS